MTEIELNNAEIPPTQEDDSETQLININEELNDEKDKEIKKLKDKIEKDRKGAIARSIKSQKKTKQITFQRLAQLESIVNEIPDDDKLEWIRRKKYSSAPMNEPIQEEKVEKPKPIFQPRYKNISNWGGKF